MAAEDPYDKLRNLPPEFVDKLKAKRDERQAKENERLEKYAREFKFRDSVIYSYRTPGGHIDPNSGVFSIAQWSDDYGNTVYTNIGSKEEHPPPDQIKALSEKIQTQKVNFGILDPSEQSRIRTDSLGGNTDSRFGAYLTNEALAQQFQKLK